MIEIPDEIAAALIARAREQGVTASGYVSRIVETTMAPVAADATDRPLETGYGMWAKYGPAPSAEEIDEDRREMFGSFGQEF
jgi:hypothetical protein